MAIKSLEVEGFRGFTKASLEDFAGVNILAGKTGCGKSSILEALYIGLALEKGLRYVLRRRGWFGIDTAKTLFSNRHEDDKKIKIKVKLQDGQSECVYIKPRIIDIPYYLTLILIAEGLITRESLLVVLPTGRTYVIRVWGQRGFVKTIEFIDWNSIYLRDIFRKIFVTMEKNLSEEVREATKKEVIEVLRKMFKDIEDIRIRLVETEPRYAARKCIVSLFFRDSKVLFHYELGDGARYTLTQAFVMLTYSNSVILIEEPELHAHPGLLYTIVDVILNSYKKRGNQIFITTHSLELIEIMLKKAKELGLKDEELKVYNLKLIDGILYSREYTLSEAYEALKEAEWDLRM